MSVLRNGDDILISCTFTNTGKCLGAEVVQVYSSAPESGIFKPLRELRSLTKLYLEPGESRKVTLSFPVSDLSYYNTKEKRRVLE